MKRIIFTSLLIITAYVSRACYADFTYTNGCAEDTVFFAASDGYAAYTWDYGDTASGANNISHDNLGYHVYTIPGTYYVTLFVNIGAEWDYRTNIIHIGTDCFQPDFTTYCYGGLEVGFSDFSTGAHNSQFWNFGDSASGINNTSSDSAPYHIFTVPGNYLITYIISDSTQTDTIMRTIHVDSTCLSAYLPDYTAALNCDGTPVTIPATFSAGVTYIHWDFGDPASGSSDTSTAPQPTHLFSGPGFYLVTLIYGDGVTFDTIVKPIPVEDCSVWPGDCNGDGEVNGEDIFPLGIYHNMTGSARYLPSTNWAGQQCATWNNGSYNWMYLQDLVDMKMADCNGDGTINAADLTAIQSNYGHKHRNHNNRSAMLEHTPTDPTLMVNAPAYPVYAGDNLTVSISLGSNLFPATDIYGGSFTLLYDAASVDAGATVNFSTGWLDSTGNSLITFYHESYGQGRLEIAFVKTNHISFSGYGTIATVTFHTKLTASGNFNVNIDGTAKIFNTNQNGGSGGNQEVFKNMYLQNASVMIINTSGIAVNTTHSASVFPNPSTGDIIISHEKTGELLLFELFNTLGEKVFSKGLSSVTASETLHISGIPAGVYHVNLKKQDGEIIVNEKLIIVN